MTVIVALAIQLVLTVIAGVVGAAIWGGFWGVLAGIGFLFAAEFVGLFLFAVAIEWTARHRNRDRDIS